MSTGAVEITAIIACAILSLAALLTLALASEWIAITVSVRFIPASKRQPRNRAGVVNVTNVIPGTVEPAAPVEPIAAARRTG